MIRTPMSVSALTALTALATTFSASMSRPESVSSRIATSGFWSASWSISRRFFSPPEKPSFRYRDENCFGTLTSSIAASVCLRKSLSEIGSSPRPSRWAFSTIRRYLVIVTPGTETGYWNAMKSPRRARSSGSASVMSSPPKSTWPSVTSRLGWPMTTLASVDLPEPLGPMSAWISPSRTTRSRPLRICLSPTWAWRLRISRSGMRSDLHQGFTLGEGDELGERRALEGLDDAALHAHPQELRGAQLAVVVVRAQHLAALGDVVDEAGRRGDRALGREDDLVHPDVVGDLGEPVAAVRAAGGLDEAGLLEQGHDALEVGERKALGLGDRLERHGRARLRVATELDEQPHPVLRLRREDHEDRKSTRLNSSHANI